MWVLCWNPAQAAHLILPPQFHFSLCMHHHWTHSQSSCLICIAVNLFNLLCPCENVKSMRKELLCLLLSVVFLPFPTGYWMNKFIAITYMPKEAREETMVKKKWRDDRRKKRNARLKQSIRISLHIQPVKFIFKIYFIALTFSPKNNMWVPTICMSLSTQWQTTNLSFRSNLSSQECQWRAVLHDRIAGEWVGTL